MRKKIFKNFLISFLIVSGLVIFRFALAQDFGTNEVSQGLNGALAQDDPRTIVGRIINIVLGFLGIISLGLIIYAGFLWMTSNGDEEKVSKARKTLINAAIGLAIILASWGIATFVLNQLSGATQGTSSSNICSDGASLSCGCGGVMYCQNGYWGACYGSNCGFGGGTGPATCDSSPNPGCQANNYICAAGYYCDSSCLCLPQGNIGDSCDLNPESATCNASDDLCGEFLSCASDTCTCFGPPVITGISPMGGFCNEDKNKSCKTDTDCVSGCNSITPNGATANFITILGNSFGEYDEGISRVYFANNQLGRNPIEINPVCINFWTNDQIVIAVPAGVIDGPISVTRSDGLSDATNDNYGPKIPDFIANNIVRPGLCGVSPESGLLGEELVYQGVNLYSGEAYFGNYQSNVQALNSNFSHPSGLSGLASLPNIRAGEADSFIVSNLGGNQEASNYIRVTKEADPKEGAYLISFSPTTGKTGQYVTISGSGFGGAKGTSRVYFGSEEANYDFPAICSASVWSDNQIIVKVPEGINNGSYYIRLDIDGKTIDSSNLSPNIFVVNNSLSLKTSLCKLEPNQGTVGTAVKVYGEYFGDKGREGLIRFHREKNISGIIDKENEADVLNVSVPEGAITGPVKVVKNDQWGNELNFNVASCKVNSDCLGQVCCPANTYKKGRCVDSLTECLIDIPNSVFEWGFSTGFTGTTISDPSETCGTLASYYGSCQTGVSCPNKPGVCSPYSGGAKQVVGECDYSCSSVAGCSGGLGSSSCTYDRAINKCVKDGSAGICSLAQTKVFTIAGSQYELNLTCNAEGNWQTITSTSCPDGYERGLDNVCVDKNSVCSLCEDGLTCERIGTEGRCVSKTICPIGSSCEETGQEKDNCIALADPGCDCCCRIGNSAQDCCAPLECAGTCGSDTTDDGAGFGTCSGCALVGTTQAEHDAACNCAGSSGQYCSISPETPNGVCSDCSNLKTAGSCANHSSVCCYDARQTVSSSNDICRGGSGLEISNNPLHPDYGYCAYYNCDSSDSSVCASSTPVKLGLFKNVYDCEVGAGEGKCNLCSLYDGKKDDCSQIASCCFDYNTSKCLGGEQITEGENSGYCAYYDCGDPQATPPQNPKVCIQEKKVSGKYSKLDACIAACSYGIGGIGQNCVSQTSASVCNFDSCNYPGAACLVTTGEVATDASDCGICCCDPSNPTSCQIGEGSNLYCQANVGNCKGENRGLCCGCQQDGECGNAATVGCGFDSCCEARPTVVSSLPSSGDENICRNAIMTVSFSQTMDLASFDNNILLLQEMEYGNGICPAGTFVYKAEQIKERNGLVKLFDNLKTKISNFFKDKIFKEETVLAQLPSADRLYCATAISLSAENSANQTIINIMPRKLLAPDTNYFLVITGDEELNSQTGIISSTGIGLNGDGLESEGSFTEGEYLKFNDKSYKNSHIIQFKTLSDKTSNSGVCEIDHIGIRPGSYLFKTTENDLDENDDNPNNKTFDTVGDRDKVFTAWAYSANNQPLQPVTGYFWNWDFKITDPAVATILEVNALEANKVLLRANSGIMDASTKLQATVDMSKFLGGNADSSPGCNCVDDVCSSHCLNAYSGGDGEVTTSTVYVFICNNPWPPINIDGTWRPWSDNCDAALGDCTDFSYKFYYCRDDGEPGTFDDLPAISDRAVIRGESAVLACSLDGSPCTTLNSVCGSDRNGDGQADGVCVWSILKESYFFREQVLPPGNINLVTDTKLGGEVLLNWTSFSNQVKSYKIYYGQAGRASSAYKEVTKEQAQCQLMADKLNCQTKINGLEDNKPYIFKLSVISENNTESILSSEKMAISSDQTPPVAPTNFVISDSVGDNLIFSWEKNDASVLNYRLYRGISSGKYGEYLNIKNQTELTLPKNTLNSGNNYFALTAFDANGNESVKSEEIMFFYED